MRPASPASIPGTLHDQLGLAQSSSLAKDVHVQEPMGRFSWTCSDANTSSESQGSDAPIHIAVVLAGALVFVLWLFVGLERVAREHGELNYEPFFKQSPSFRTVLENTAQCGECDLRPWSVMDQEDRDRFADYCAVRFGLDQVRLCYAIFAEKQRMARERPLRADPAP